MSETDPASREPEKPRSRSATLLDLFWTFLKIGAFTFGGGYAMIAMVQADVVTRKHWVSEKQYIDIIAISQATPGVIAINLATYVGYVIGGFWGSLLATLAVSLPSFFIIMIISFFLDAFLALEWVGYAFNGIRAGILVLIFDAVLKLRKSMPVNVFTLIVFGVAFILATITGISVIYLILGGAVLGLIWQIFITHAYDHPSDEKEDKTASGKGGAR